MKRVLIQSCLAVILLAMYSASAMPNLDLAQKPTVANTGSFASSLAPSININSVEMGQAAYGNFMPVNLTISVTQFLSDSKAVESVCGLERFDFEVDALEIPLNGKAARIMSVAPIYAPCSYLISIIPTTDYLNSGSPNRPSPAKQNTWVNGVYTLSLRYLKGGNEVASKTFSFTIGGSTTWIKESKFHKVEDGNSKMSPLP